MTVTWTSGYDIDEAVPFVEWGPKGGKKTRSPAGTLTFSRNSMCGMSYFDVLRIVLVFYILQFFFRKSWNDNLHSLYS